MIACAPHVVLGLLMIGLSVGIGVGWVMRSFRADREWWDAVRNHPSSFHGYSSAGVEEQLSEHARLIVHRGPYDQEAEAS